VPYIYFETMNRIEKLKALLEQQPGDNFLQHALALEYEKLGDADAALVLFETIITTNPAYTGSYYHFARLLYQNGNETKALEIYRQGMDACRTHGDAHALRELQAAYDELTG
jgi:tetratricopeptide (TPR) repeat protein